MATVVSNQDRKFTINGANIHILGDASTAVVGTFSVHIVSNAFVGTITVKARARGEDASDDGVAFVATVYEKLHLNGAVGDGTLVSTGITGTSLILIPASGLQIALDVTAYTSGTCTVYVTPLEGAAA